MPARLAAAFQALGDCTIWRPRVGLPRCDVAVHWSWRFGNEPGNRWLPAQIVALFEES